MLNYLFSRLSASRSPRLRSLSKKSQRRITKWFYSYGPRELEAALRAVGIGSGDTVMLHAAFSMSGFRGTPKDIADVFLQTIGPTGNLLMVSMPYSGSTHDYLKGKPTFDVKKTASYMGMVSESFRKREGVLRSLNPAHPVLALGPKAEWIVADHDKCLYSCGPGSPFEKLHQLAGKIVVYHVRFPTITYVHYGEHFLEKMLPFPLYDAETFEVPSIDASGELKTVKTRPFSPEAVRRRRPLMAVELLEKNGLIRSKRVGNSGVLAIEAKDSFDCFLRMTREGWAPFDLT